MPNNGELITVLRKGLSDLSIIKSNGFSLLKDLSQFVSSRQNEIEAQELVLRALEYRDHFKGYQPMLDALVREIGLFPYLNPESLTTLEQIAYEFHRPLNMDEDIVFHKPQAKIYRMLLDGENVALSAPTSFGKSLIIDAIIASGHFKNIVIIVPTIALIDETRRRLAKRFQGKFKIITHTFQTRTEKNIYVLTQERMLEFGTLGEIDFFVIDEFYKLTPGRDDDDRCWLLNQAFYKLVQKCSQFYMLGPGILGLSKEFQQRIECKFINEPYHTVVSELIKVPPSKNEFDALIELCKKLDEPTIIFCRSPKRVTDVALQLIASNLRTKCDVLNDVTQWTAEHYHPEWHFVKALQNGIGIHHARIPRSLSQYVVRQFNEGTIRFLVCTSTLIEGVNTKAKNIIIFDNKINRDEIDLFTFNNIRGRAGRMFQHFIGHVYVFNESPQTRLPFVDIPVYSQNAPPSLLIHIDENELTESSKSRLSEYKNQDIVSYETLKKNIGVDLDSQIKIAETLADDSQRYNKFLKWTGYPTYDELKVICNLIWDYFNGPHLGSGSIRSAGQLAYAIHRLQSLPKTRDLINKQLEYLEKEDTSDVDEAVQRVLDFLRLWANFHFPRLLRALDNIQRDIFGRLGLPVGNYELYASSVENLFLDPAIFALDEYGIPLELAKKLQDKLNPKGDFDKALSVLKQIQIEDMKLSNFEIELIKDAQTFI